MAVEPDSGLHLNPLKCLIWCGAGDSLPPEVDVADPLERGIPCASDRGFLLLGAPVGDIPFSRDVVHDPIGKIGDIFDVLPSLNDAQIEHNLLRHCYSLPKLSYCLRTCNASHLLPTYQYFDDLQLSTFSLIIGRQLDEAARQQAFLPVVKGGTGLRSATHQSPAAFIASSAQSKAIVDALLPPSVSRRPFDEAFLVKTGEKITSRQEMTENRFFIAFCSLRWCSVSSLCLR